MISDEQFREFGFEKSQFPRKIISQAVTLGLPSADANQVEPVTVVIDRGLLVPTQAPGALNGMIIKDDGTILHIGHEDPYDPKTPLKATYIEDIPYDVRSEIYNIMKRAVEVDADLSDVWAQIHARWMERFPSRSDEVQRHDRGLFDNIQTAFEGIVGLVEQFVEQALEKAQQPDVIPVKIIVQTQEELQHGWHGEEFWADTSTVGQIRAAGMLNYRQALGQRLKALFKNPVFHSKSAFRIYYESRMVPSIKLIVIAPAEPSVEFPQGIDLDV